MKNILSILLILLLFSACQQTQRDRVADLIRKWEGKEILFPKGMTLTMEGQNYEDSTFFDTNHMILAYVDSFGCFSCKLRLNEWKKLIKELDSVPVLFVFCPLSIEEVYSSLRQEHFPYPVCIDTTDILNQLNQFPPEENFHTFLLDKDKKVVGIGNPIQNPKIRELYRNRIIGREPPLNKTRPLTEVRIDNSSINLRQFSWKQQQKCVFILHNTGKKLLVIDNVKTSCGCISASYSQEPVKPGQSLNMTIVYKADHPEHFDKSIKVYCNTSGSPLQLRITGDAQ